MTIRLFQMIAFVLASIGCSSNSQYTARPNTAKAEQKQNTQAAEVVAGPVQTQQPKPQPQASAAPVAEKTAAPQLIATVPPYGTCSQPCNGESKVMFNTKYSKWIKVVLCSPSRYDILMSESQSGPFFKVGDTGGHGQDHCELVNANFADLRSDDDITSGNCPTCKAQSAGTVVEIPKLFGGKIYSRSKFGTPFVFEDATRWGIHTSCWYECGVSF